MNRDKDKSENIQNIISQIHEKGVREAEEKGKEIVTKAKQEAETMLQNSKDEATAIIENARHRANELKNSAEHQVQISLKNAAELLKQKTLLFLTNLLTEMTRKKLDDSQFLGDLIREAVKKWANGERVTISASTNILERMDKSLLEGKTLEINDSLHGFTIKKEGDFITWEVTDESIAEILAPLLSAQIAEFLKKATAEEEEYHG